VQDIFNTISMLCNVTTGILIVVEGKL